MEKAEIIKEVEEKITHLLEEKKREQDRFKVISEYQKRIYPFRATADGKLSYNVKDLLAMVIGLNYSQKEFDEYISLNDQFQDLYVSCKSMTLSKLFNFLSKYSSIDNEFSTEIACKMLPKVLPKICLSDSVLDFLIQISQKNHKAFQLLVDSVVSFERFTDEMNVLHSCKENYKNMTRGNNQKRVFSNRSLAMFIETETKRIYAETGFKDCIEKIINQYQQQHLQYKKNLGENSRKISGYQQFRQKFNLIAKESEIVNARDLVQSIPDEEFQGEVLAYIYNYNLSHYEKLQDRYSNISNPELHNFLILLQKYEIILDEEQAQKLLLLHNPQECEVILSIIKDIKITDPSTILGILYNGSAERLVILSSLVGREIISSQFIRDNLQLLTKDSPDFETLLHHVSLFEANNINPKYLMNNTNILLKPVQQLQQGINTLTEYGLHTSIKQTTELEFLSQENLSTLIDTILEYGFEKELVHNIDLLNFNETKWKRVGVLKLIGEEVNGYEELVNILGSHHFFLSDDVLDQYLDPPTTDALVEQLSKIELETPLLEPPLLKNCSSSERTYMISGRPFSKNRVDRNYTKLSTFALDEEEKTFFSMITGSRLSPDKIQSIEEINSPAKTKIKITT